MRVCGRYHMSVLVALVRVCGRYHMVTLVALARVCGRYHIGVKMVRLYLIYVFIKMFVKILLHYNSTFKLS